MSPAPKYNQQQQEDIILNAASKCIEETSLLDFTMAKIAKTAGLSMGSVYKHVQSKEDILVALATKVARQHNKTFTEIMALPLTMPERLISSFLISREKIDPFPFGVYLEMLVGNEAVVKRASRYWTDTYARMGHSISNIFSDAVMHSLANGELRIKGKYPAQTIDMILEPLWALDIGFTQVAYQKQAWSSAEESCDLPFPLSPGHSLIESAKRLINALSWQMPLDENGIGKACTMLSGRGYR